MTSNNEPKLPLNDEPEKSEFCTQFHRLMNICKMIKRCTQKSNEDGPIWLKLKLFSNVYNSAYGKNPTTTDKKFLEYFQKIYYKHHNEILEGPANRDWLSHDCIVKIDKNCSMYISTIFREIDKYSEECTEKNEGNMRDIVLPEVLLNCLYEIFKLCTNDNSEKQLLDNHIKTINEELQLLLSQADNENNNKNKKNPFSDILGDFDVSEITNFLQKVSKDLNIDEVKSPVEIIGKFTGLVNDPVKSEELISQAKNICNKVMNGKDGNPPDFGKIIQKASESMGIKGDEINNMINNVMQPVNNAANSSSEESKDDNVNLPNNFLANLDISKILKTTSESMGINNNDLNNLINTVVSKVAPPLPNVDLNKNPDNIAPDQQE